jgi:hypothetical protein
MKIVGKLSVKTVVGNVPTKDAKAPKMANGVVVMDKDGAPVMETVQRGIKQNLMRVFGQCDRVKLGNTAFGETVEFQGQFEATNMLDGEIYRSNRLFLPPVLTEMVRSQVIAAQGDDPANDAAVQFAFDIGADSANNAHGYQYTIEPLTPPSKSDPLEAMRAALLANAKPLQIGGAKAEPEPDRIEVEANKLVDEIEAATENIKAGGKKAK